MEQEIRGGGYFDQIRQKALIGALTIVSALGVYDMAVRTPSASAAADQNVQILETDNGQHFVPVAPTSDPANQETIYVNNHYKYQTFKGVGSAMTNSSAYVLNKLSPSLNWNVVNDMYGKGGADSGIIRVPIGPSDYEKGGVLFNPDNYSNYAQTLKELKMARRANPNVIIMAMPWSPPARMKTNHSLLNAWGNFGSLIQGDEWNYAQFIANFDEYMHRHGVNININGVLNEPGDVNNEYPASGLSSTQEVRVIDDLKTILRAARLATKVYAYDASWGGSYWGEQVLRDSNADGILYHCYNGSPTVMAKVRHMFPNKDVLVSECARQDLGNISMAQLAIESFQEGASAVLGWNFALNDHNPNGPVVPHDKNCGACTGTDTIHAAMARANAVQPEGIVTTTPDPTKVSYSREFFDDEAFGHFIPRGARRVFSTHRKYSNSKVQESSGVDDVVFNFGKEDTMVAYNNTSLPQNVTVQAGSERFSFVANPNATIDVTFPAR